MKSFRFGFLLVITALSSWAAEAFTIPDPALKTCILFSPTDPKLVEIAAGLLADDLQRVTGVRPVVVNDVAKAEGQVIFLGTVASPLVNQLADARFPRELLNGKWESYIYHAVEKPTGKIAKAFLVVGSDRRGVAYGALSISERIGVSPWYWWADVPVAKRASVSLPESGYVSPEPTVKYRGIFLNDEDWGLQPWAAKTFEPEVGNLGPKTYSRIFELLLRLKANLIWPAMHHCSRPFFTVPGNREAADAHGILIGSSHAEPMLRNNVGEWDASQRGEFNYLTNRDNVLSYWRERVKEVSGAENIYTLGMRGIHDSPMVGARSVEERVSVLRDIIERQRGMLAGATKGGLPPQVFVPYKEVLDVYDGGLALPGDVTLMWTDDNYGYVRRFSDADEQKRAGRAGVYYHVSYWGSPHDYLWLPSTHPMLIWQEMTKAYETGADRVWVLNVGDIKPLEYPMELFLDMAYDATAFKRPQSVREHLAAWAAQNFGAPVSRAVADVVMEYYKLAFERRPEFMGWSTVEPVTQTASTQYNHFYFGDEAQRRLERYQQLEKSSEEIWASLTGAGREAYFELVHYAVSGASALNHRILLAEKAELYAKQHRLVANDLARWASEAQARIATQTKSFNEDVAQGKWRKMVSAAPRNLPVFTPPGRAQWEFAEPLALGVMPEAMPNEHSAAAVLGSEEWYEGRRRLPTFSRWTKPSYFVDLFINAPGEMPWVAEPKDDWVLVSTKQGVLTSAVGRKQQRVWISVDWAKAPKSAASSSVAFRSGEHVAEVKVNVGGAATGGDGESAGNASVRAEQGSGAAAPGAGELAEDSGYIAFYARSFTGKREDERVRWSTLDGLGYSGGALAGLPLTVPSELDLNAVTKQSPYVEYTFFVEKAADAVVNVYCIPSHPLSRQYEMRFAAQVDAVAPRVLNFKTEGRSPEWKQNVLRNSARVAFKAGRLMAGKHVLRLYRMDPGVVFDWIAIDLGGLKPAYSALEETRARRRANDE